MANINPRRPKCVINVEPGAKGFLGASSWAGALGVSSFKNNTPLACFHKFNGTAPAITEEMQEIYDRGHRWEAYIAQEVSAIYGYKLRKVNGAYVHPERDTLICHPDRLMVGRVEGKRIGVEIKSSSSYTDKKWGAPDTDDIPDDYKIQCMGYLSCGVCDEVHLFRCDGNFKITRYVIRYNAEDLAALDALLFQAVDKFAQGIEPAPYSRDEALAAFPNPEGAMVADETTEALCDEYDKARDAEAAAKKTKEEIRDRIIVRMEGAQKIVSAMGRTLHSFTVSERTSFDMDAFKTDNPELFEKYTTKKTISTFR